MRRRDAAAHLTRSASRLAPLRDDGVLILGSGNIVHNLHAYAWGDHSAAAYDWALRFEGEARQLLAHGDFAPLVDYESTGPAMHCYRLRRPITTCRCSM
jgi:4,5-DOPA dioxygenase extradiol